MKGGVIHMNTLYIWVVDGMNFWFWIEETRILKINKVDFFICSIESGVKLLLLLFAFCIFLLLLLRYQRPLSFMAISTISRLAVSRAISISIAIAIAIAIPSFSSFSCSCPCSCWSIPLPFSSPCSRVSCRSAETCSSAETCFSGLRNPVRISALGIRDLMSRERKREGEARRR